MIRVKNKEIAWHEGMTIAVLLETLNDPFPYAAALINEQFVRRREFETTPIPDEAEVVLIAGVGGG